MIVILLNNMVMQLVHHNINTKNVCISQKMSISMKELNLFLLNQWEWYSSHLVVHNRPKIAILIQEINLKWIQSKIDTPFNLILVIKNLFFGTLITNIFKNRLQIKKPRNNKPKDSKNQVFISLINTRLIVYKSLKLIYDLVLQRNLSYKKEIHLKVINLLIKLNISIFTRSLKIKSPI